MLPKKSRKADLQSKRAIFFQIGLIVALGFSIVAFKVGQKEKQNVVVFTTTDIDVIEIPPLVRPEKDKTVAAPRHQDVDFINIIDSNTEPRMELPDDFFNETGEIYLPELDTRNREKGDPNDFFISVEIMPKFMGGDLVTFRNWVMQNIVYPQVAIDANISGRVTIEFIVDTDGKITAVKVLQSPDKSLSEAAMKTLAKSPTWEPGRQQSQKARVKFTLPIEFKLD